MSGYTYQVEHSVPVKIVAGGVEQDAHLGISIKDDDGRRVFGLITPPEMWRVTYMSYGLDYFDPRVILVSMKAEGVEWWRFLATGDDRHDVKISIRELEVALYRLKLVDHIGEDA